MTSTRWNTLVTSKHMKSHIVLSGAIFYNKIIKPRNTVVNEGSNSSKMMSKLYYAFNMD